jgi:trans-2,3-dihydro-3-hydroxyanthranilate isomerase
MQSVSTELHGDMQVEFVTVDVFTDRQFGGNPLAVVADGTGLSTSQMQAIAAEFNLAETTFVLTPDRPENTAKVRIFTPRAELPFAGHPNIGTAFVLGRLGGCHGRPIQGDTLQFEEIAGLVRIELWRDGSSVIGARLAAPQPFAVIEDVEPEVIAEVCTISAADIEMGITGPASRVAACALCSPNSRTFEHWPMRNLAPTSLRGTYRWTA